MKQRQQQPLEKQQLTSDSAVPEGDCSGGGDAQAEKEVVPGVSIIRSSTPKPLNMGPDMSLEEYLSLYQQEEAGEMAGFPVKAPSAPPLPEELDEQEEEGIAQAVTPRPQSAHEKSIAGEDQEFLWLFEYGLEMDAIVLNSPERLDGLALQYGPALLKGYSVLFGKVECAGERERGERTIVTIVPGPDPAAEVWGILYRVPRHLAEQSDTKPSILNAAHAATMPDKYYRPAQATVQEIYHNRIINCVTYIATDEIRKRLQPLSTQYGEDALFIQRMAAIARKHKLPESYLTTSMGRFLCTPVVPKSERTGIALSEEQHTDPLPAVLGAYRTALPQPEEHRGATAHEGWLVVFALYLYMMLLIVLLFAVLQGIGFGSEILTRDLYLLNVPWLVLVYGLIGGCISSIARLGRYQERNPPIFVVITWFTRPFIGAVLALFAYLLLTCGIFVLSRNIQGHQPLFVLVGALAGLCEGWIFVRRKV